MLKIERERAFVLIIDVQVRLASVMPAEAMAAAQKNVLALLGGARLLELPVLATEQYPQGLGPTLPSVRAALPEGVRPIAKQTFSCAAAAAVHEVLSNLAQSGRTQVIACGMETHICVFQTVRDLVQAGLQVFVPQDAVLSRTEDNRRVGLDLMTRAGAVVSSTETLLFDLLGQAGTPEFKAIAALIK